MCWGNAPHGATEASRSEPELSHASVEEQRAAIRQPPTLCKPAAMVSRTCKSRETIGFTWFQQMTAYYAGQHVIVVHLAIRTLTASNKKNNKFDMASSTTDAVLARAMYS